MNIASSQGDSFDDSVRMSAATYFKNVVFYCWTEKVTVQIPFLLSDAAKEVCKQMIVPATVNSNVRVRKVLQEALKMMADVDWPEKWPRLVEQLAPMLKYSSFGQESHRVMGAATCLRLCVRRYQYLNTDVQNRKRWPVHRMAALLLGPYLQMLQDLNSVNSQQSVEMRIIILKTFWTLVQQEVPPCLYEKPQLVKPWIEAIVRVLLEPIPNEVQPADETLRPKFCWWILKKWAAKILYRISSRHGVESDVIIPPDEPSDDLIAYEQGSIDPATWNKYRQAMNMKKQFAAFYEQNLLAPIFVSVLQVMSLVGTNTYLSPSVLTNLFRYCGFAIRQAMLWRILEPQVDKFLANVVYRVSHLTKHDVSNFFEDPEEFVRSISDLRKLSHNARLQAMYLLKDIVRLRKLEHLDAFMNFLSSRLAASPEPLEKEAILTCLGTMSAELMDNKKYGPMVETILEKHVYPEIGSAKGGPLEWRALWVMGRFWTAKFRNWNNVLGACRNAVQCLQSRHVATRLMAAEVLPSLLNLPPVAEAVESVLPQVVQWLLAIAQKHDSEEVMTALEALVNKYPTKMATLALQILPHIIQSFKRASADQGEKSDKAALAAQGSLDLLVTVVDECAEHTKEPQMWQALEAQLVPFLLQLINQNSQTGVWEMGVKLLCAITFEPPFPNGNLVWNALPSLHASWQQWAQDYTLEIVEAWDNFLTNNPERCLQTSDIMNAIQDIVKASLKEDADDDEREGGLKLVQSCLANLRGKIDNLVGPWLGLLFQNIQWAIRREDEEFVVDLTCMTLLFVWYNPVLTVGMLEQQKLTQQLLQATFKNVEGMYTKRLKKMAILGLSTLLQMPAQRMPQSIKSSINKVIQALLQLQMDLWQQKDEEEAYQKAEEAGEVPFEGEDDEGQLADENVGDDQNVDDFERDGPIDVDFLEGAADDGAFDILGGEEAEELCHTLDKIDEVVLWADSVAAFSNSAGDVFGKIMNGLSKKEKENHLKLTKLAEEKRNNPPQPKK